MEKMMSNIEGTRKKGTVLNIKIKLPKNGL